MSTSETLAIVDEASSDPESLTAGDVGVIASFLSDLQPNELMNATVGLHGASRSTFLSFCHSTCSQAYVCLFS